jgi:outer membrane protein assembly factor BamB
MAVINPNASSKGLRPGLFVFLSGILFTGTGAAAADWPQFLGPSRNAVYPTNDLAKTWPAEGPKKLWQGQVGQGFSGPVVTGGRVVLFHRIENQETIQSFDATNGAAQWKHQYPTSYRDSFGFDEGPRATPAIADGKIYTYGAQGMLSCVSLEKGEANWSRDLQKDYQAPKGFFGICSSPLVHGNAVVLNVGGKDGAAVCAFDCRTGKTLWKTGNDETSYSSPVAAQMNGGDYLFCLTTSMLFAIDPANGHIHFSYPFRPPIRASVSAATPVVVDDTVFISGAYDTGSALVRVSAGGFEKIWAGEDFISSHYANSIAHAGFLYGIHGRTDPGWEPAPSLRCIELKTGKLRWEKKEFGAANLMLAGGEILALTERGELLRIEANPAAFKTTARAQVLPNHARAYPALANGRFYARSEKDLVSFQLR